MSALRRLVTRLRWFGRSEDGSISVEAMLILPILVWAYMGTFVFFDAFRAQATNIKAGYAIADTISRETGYITPAFLDSLYNLQEFLVSTDEQVQMRVSVFSYRASDDSYRVRWSRTRGGGANMTDAVLAQLRPNLPVMPNGEVAIMVETRVGYVPAFSVGLSDFTFEDLVVTRPRFAGQVCMNTSNTGGASTATC